MACGATAPAAPHRCRHQLSLRDGHAVQEELDHAGGQSGRLQGVDAVLRVEVEPVGDLRVEDPGGRGKAAHLHGGRVPAHVDRVVAVGAVDDDVIGRAVGRHTAPSAREVDDDARDVGPGEVVHGDEVGAAEGVEVDGLDAGGVHRDVRLS